jgi:acyl carrier protein
MEAKNAETINGWLVEYVGKLLDVDPATIDVNVPIERFGLDSAAAIELVSELGDWLKVDLEPTIVFDHRTIRSLAEHVASVGAGVS